MAVTIRAETGFDVFMRQWEIATGHKERVAEFRIALNPDVRVTSGYPTMDDRAFGVVHVTLGRNTGSGGQNQSSLRCSMLLMHPSLTLDGCPFLERGRFVGG